MYCWYCYWGWAKAVAAIYDAALKELGGDESPLLYGPGHIVWCDENFEDDNVRWCLRLYEPGVYEGIYPGKTFAGTYLERFTPEEMAVVRRSLERLLAEVPEEVRACAPEGYEDSGGVPEDWPPPAELEMVKR